VCVCVCVCVCLCVCLCVHVCVCAHVRARAHTLVLMCTMSVPVGLAASGAGCGLRAHLLGGHPTGARATALPHHARHHMGHHVAACLLDLGEGGEQRALAQHLQWACGRKLLRRCTGRQAGRVQTTARPRHGIELPDAGGAQAAHSQTQHHIVYM